MVLPSGVVTFLLTDVVGSTRLWDTDPEAMSVALQRHDQLVAGAVTGAGGHVVKARGEGDATFCVFARTTDAVRAALDLDRAVRSERWPPSAQIELRMALHTGEAVERDGDYFGGTVNRAARLRGAAAPGRIVVSQAVAELAVDHLPEGATLVPIGSHELAGLARPELVHELRPGAAAPAEGPTGGLELRLLGRFEARLDGVVLDLGPPKQRAVLALLALEVGRTVPVARLVELLWGDAPKAQAALQTYVSNLRRILEPHRRPRDPARVLVTEAPGYRLDLPPDALDTTRFETLVQRGRARLHAGAPGEAAEALDAALELWAGPPLPELGDEPYVVEAAARFAGRRADALAVATQARLDLGDHAGAVAVLDGPIAEHPHDERLHGLLALGLYRSGRQADALRVIDRVRRALAEDVGLDPGPELRALEADLLRQEPSPPPAPAAPTPAPEPTPPPTAASVPASTPLVGRSAELDLLVRALDAAAGGRGTSAVVLGEPGIGKTRLVEELAAVARARGFVTAWVRCPESGAIPPFWPAAQLAAQAQAAGASEQALVPPDDAEATPPATLFALYEAVCDALVRVTSPLLLVIDDLQWADADTLRMLAHVAGSLTGTRVLLAVTVRPVDDDTGPALVDGLDALARTPGAVHVPLGGLGRDAVAEWLGSRADVEVPDEVSATVHERTGGHPLFVKELSELLASEGHLGDVEAVRQARTIPTGVQSVVRRRVARLPVSTQQLLSSASVVGRSFDLAVVASVADQPLDEALATLEPALAADLLLDDGPARFRFSHALVADALAAELNAARRARLHAATARTLVSRAGGVRGPDVALIAHHAMGGVLAGTADLAVEASTEAARLAAARFGYEDAAEHRGRVVEALAAARPGDHAARIDALCELATAGFRADLVPAAQAAALEAIELAESAGDTASMARAAALFGSPHVWPNQRYGDVDQQLVSALERTRRAVATEPARVRAPVLGALAVELTYADPGVCAAVRAEAEEVARESGDPAVLGRVLVNVADPLSPVTLDEREARAAEALQLATDHGLPADLELAARFQLTVAAWERADFPVALERLAACTQLADRSGGGAVRVQLSYFRAAVAVARGNYDEAARLGAEASQLHRRTRRLDADLIELALYGSIAADLGGFEDMLDHLDHALSANHNYDRLSLEFLAWMFLEAGMVDESAEMVARVQPDTPFAMDYTMLCAATMGLQVRAALGDVAGAEQIMGQLEPYRGRWAQAGTGGCCGGLVELSLARGAEVAGDPVRARELYAAAVAGHERLRTPAWLARSLVHQGRFLLRAGDEQAGRDALGRAGRLAGEHRLAYVARRVSEP